MSDTLDTSFDDFTDNDVRDISVDRIDWQGIVIEVRYEAHYLGLPDLAHLDITSVLPECAPLPITGTGYRSHFLDALDVEDAGGPVRFVLRWIESEAMQPDWIQQDAVSRQYVLF